MKLRLPSPCAGLLALILPLIPVSTAWGDVILYPKKGQSPDQQNRDRYECHLWAVQQSGYDPSAPPAAAPQQAQGRQGEVLRGGLRGAAAGAAIGAIAGDAGKGAAIGATAGGLKKGFERLDRNRAAQSQPPAPPAGQDVYERAMRACLTGRDYSVN